MELDSVRELKTALSQQLVEPLATRTAARSLNLSAQRVTDADALHRTIALGVARKGRKAFHLAVRIQRRGLEDSAELDKIRRQAKGEVDVRYIGRVMKRAAAPWYQQRCRPLCIGCSIGHHRITAGTLGCFVKSLDDGATLILSNNHVLADENRGKIGDDILQPGPHDGGTRSRDAIGQLARVVRLRREGSNEVDCAACSIKSRLQFDAGELRGFGRLAGLGDVVIDAGDEVAKLGRTTGLTRGRVTAFELDNVIVGFDIGVLRFDNQVEVEGAGDEPFSDGGDSGSLVFDKGARAVGLLFAGGDQGGSNGKGLTYVNPLRAVLERLKVDLLYS